MVVAPEVEGALPIIRRLTEEGVRVAIGHSAATHEEALAGLEAGISHATHLFNAMRGIASTDIGVAGTVLTSDQVTAELVADCVHVHPAMLALAVRLKGPDGIALISDAIRAAGLPDGVYRHRESDEELHVRDGAVRLRDGTLAGSTLTLNRAIRNMVDRAEVPLLDAVTMATRTPARVAGVAESKGALEAGMDADVAILDSEFEVWMTLVGGRRFESERQ
jgi:N-acetylglucosamine-6-phosphate deacetylase